MNVKKCSTQYTRQVLVFFWDGLQISMILTEEPFLILTGNNQACNDRRNYYIII
jgi:hypothetical protein